MARRRWLISAAALVLGCGLFQVRGVAQTPDTATMRGQVLDQSGAAITGASVTVLDDRTAMRRQATTDASGLFALPGLPATDSYKVSVRKEGFAEARLNGVSLLAGTTASLKIHLNASGGATRINVTGVAGEVRSDAPQLGISLGRTLVQEIPLPNRRVTYLPLLSAANRPAISQGDLFMNQNLFTTNGAGRRQTWFEVDGANAVDLWGRQTIFTNIPVDAVQEMTVLSNAFSAEYGAGVGSVVNIVTRGGGDKYHGSIFGLWKPAETSAHLSGFAPGTAISGAQITSDTLQQTAAALSGPIGAGGRTHFALDAEYSRQDRGSPVTSPLSPGDFVGRYRSWLGFLHLDRQLTQGNTIFFRGDSDSFHDTNPGGAVGGNTLPSVGRAFKRRTYAAEVGETAVLSPALLNNVRAQFQLASPITEFAPFLLDTQFQVPIAGVATFTTGTSQAAKLLNRQFEFTDTLSAIRGRHTLKFGADIIHARNGGNSKEFGGPIYLGQFVYNTCTLAVAVCESAAYLDNIANVKTYTQSYGNAGYTVDDTLWSAFAQDDLRVTANLTANLGLRYERQTFTDDANNVAPRVGFAYNLHGKGTLVIRGGFGVYYSQIPDNAAANYALSGPTGVFNYTAAPGQIGFPASVSAAPLPAFPAGAVVPLRTLFLRPGRSGYYDQFLPTSALTGYQDKLLNPYSEQWTLGLEKQLAANWVLSVDYLGSRTEKINRPLDVNPPSPFVRTAPGQSRSPQAANYTRPYWIWWYRQNGGVCDPVNNAGPRPPYALVQGDVNDGYASYNALDLNLKRQFSHGLAVLVSYTWSHALDNVDPDVPGQNPNDPNLTGHQEYGNAIYDQRHRFVLSGVWTGPLHIDLGGVATLASGLPYNLVTGTTNSGDTGGTTDRPVINGAVVGRNTGRGRAIYEVSPFLQRVFALGSERVRLNLRAEAFNVFNHPNFIGYAGTYGNGASAPAGLGQPLTGVAAQLPARSFQFSAKLMF